MSNSLVEHLSVEKAIPAKQTKSDDGQDLLYVSARAVYTWLDVKEQFHRWFKRCIAKNKMIHRRDYVLASDYQNLDTNEIKDIPLDYMLESTTYGNDRLDYFITVVMAKHVVMMSATDKGIEARNYFIRCEQELFLAMKREMAYLQQLHAQQLEIARLQIEAAERKAQETLQQLGNEVARSVQYGRAAQHLQLANTKLEKSNQTLDQYHIRALHNYSDMVDFYRKEKEAYDKKIEKLENKIDSLRTANVYSSRPDIDNVIWLAKKHKMI